MPELPEVETVRRGLAPLIRGRAITNVLVRDRRLRRTIAPDFEARLSGRVFGEIGRRGKYLLFEIDSSDTLLVHLGMSGCLRLRDRAIEPERHDHVEIELARNDVLVLNDPRRFGSMRVGPAAELTELFNVGPDPLSEERSIDEWRAGVRGRRMPIKTLLMNQTFVAGIGNIYANEMLFEAGIRPRRMASRLNRAELARLDEAMRRVLHRAVELGGSSISDFRGADGKPGYFQIHHAVYDKEGTPCRQCRTPIKRVTLGGRSTFYCPACQR